MPIPYFSVHELWRQASSESLGFYTRITKNKIPNKPGIYSWFLPLDMAGDLAVSMPQYKELFSYSTRDKDVFSKNFLFDYQWQSFELGLKAVPEYRKQSTYEDKWRSIFLSESEETKKAIEQVVSLASIFSRPLYIGLTRNLSSRYEQHVNGYPGNNFHRRFSDFCQENNYPWSVKDLVFAALPVQLDDGSPWLADASVEVIEYVLKNIVGPVFGEV